MAAPERSWRPKVRVLWSIWANRLGISMYGEDFDRAYIEWEFTHMNGMDAISGPLYRQYHIAWLGWEIHTPWRIYARSPAAERYRPGDRTWPGTLR